MALDLDDVLWNTSLLALTCAAQCRSKVGKSTLTAFIDFQKAYDNTNHISLWQKLEKTGITGQP